MYKLLLFLSFVCFSVVSQAQTVDIYKLYMETPTDQFTFLDCLIEETSLEKRQLIKYKPNESVLVLNDSCEGEEVMLYAVSKTKIMELVGADIHKGISSCQLTDLRTNEAITIALPIIRSLTEFIDTKQGLSNKLKMAGIQASDDTPMKWGIDSYGRLTCYVPNHNNTKIHVATWILRDNKFVQL